MTPCCRNIYRVFNIHYICILFSAFVGCYEDCDMMHDVCNIKFEEKKAGSKGNCPCIGAFRIFLEGGLTLRLYIIYVLFQKLC